MEPKDCTEYCLNRLMALEKENADLRAEVERRKEENSAMSRSTSLYYSINWYSWYVKEDNYKDYARAVSSEDFDWLYRNGLTIESYLVDFEFTFNNTKYLFAAKPTENGSFELTPIEIDGKNYFGDYDGAKKFALKQVMEKVSEYAKEEEKEESADVQQAS